MSTLDNHEIHENPNLRVLDLVFPRFGMTLNNIGNLQFRGVDENLANHPTIHSGNQIILENPVVLICYFSLKYIFLT